MNKIHALILILLLIAITFSIVSITINLDLAYGPIKFPHSAAIDDGRGGGIEIYVEKSVEGVP